MGSWQSEAFLLGRELGHDGGLIMAVAEYGAEMSTYSLTKSQMRRRGNSIGKTAICTGRSVRLPRVDSWQDQMA